MPETYARVAAAFMAAIWSILPEKLDAIRGVLLMRLRGEQLPPEAVEAARREAPPVRREGKVAVIPIFGTISQRPSAFSSGGTSTERIGQLLDAAAADSTVSAIVLNVDSPGGTVFGVSELAAKIRDVSREKRTVAVANSMAASAAYWLASQAGEVVVTPGGMVGSIGVFSAHDQVGNDLEADRVKTTLVSAGKYKVEANPFEPLSEDARAAMQAEVDRYYSMFVADVARGRGRRGDTVRNGFGQGRMVGAEQAVGEGMADRVDTLEGTLRRLGASLTASPAATNGTKFDANALENRLKLAERE